MCEIHDLRHVLNPLAVSYHALTSNTAPIRKSYNPRVELAMKAAISDTEEIASEFFCEERGIPKQIY